MEGPALGEDPLSDFDWDAFLEQLPDPHVDYIFHEKEVPSFVAGDRVLSEIENLLMADDEDDGAVIPATPSLESDYDKHLAEILVEPDGDSDDGSTPSNEDPDKDRADAADLKEVGTEPVSKKLTRKMRNRDAAVRSRERKKLYVKDLEMKSTGCIECFHDQAGVCCALVGIPAVGFPAVVHGCHVPIQSTTDSLVNGTTYKRKQGAEKRKKGNSKRTRK